MTVIRDVRRMVSVDDATRVGDAKSVDDATLIALVSLVPLRAFYDLLNSPPGVPDLFTIRWCRNVFTDVEYPLSSKTFRLATQAVG